MSKMSNLHLEKQNLENELRGLLDEWMEKNSATVREVDVEIIDTSTFNGPESRLSKVTVDIGI